MVTKLKNSRKFAAVLIFAVILSCACGMVAAYPVFKESMETAADDGMNMNVADDMISHLVWGNYFLYNEVYGNVERGYIMNDFENSLDSFALLQKYMDYEVFDYSGEAQLGENSDAVLKKLAKEGDTYALCVSFLFDLNGSLEETKIVGSQLDEREQYTLEQRAYKLNGENWGELAPLENPEDVKIIYGITEENLEKYINDVQKSYTEEMQAAILSNRESYLMFEWMLCFVVIAAAFAIPCCKSWRVEEFPVFHAPFEAVFLVWNIAVGQEHWYAKVVWNTINHTLTNVAEQIGFYSPASEGVVTVLNLAMWFCVFAVVYWGAACLREIFTMKKAYWKERTLCAKLYTWLRSKNDRYAGKMKQGADDAAGFLKRLWRSFRRFLHRIYDSLIHLDFQDKTNQTILRIVLINFIVLVLICCLWFYGIAALMIYSLILFLFLRKYFRDIQKKYQLLLQSTNLLAEGNLDTPIEGDMGIFNPMKTEIQKIQKGFKKAVQEEVKSERMKTELITNVSHDLKTPLTAIITYIDLLKSEKDPEKQKEYLEVLERKSLRLKVLIEDLFEISKATSKNVTMNFMNVDIVGLLKQVGLEYDSRIKETNLEFRWNLPDTKVVLVLDSQKTYRIFENLIVNITKYAMPHTRVYVELTETENQVMIFMKNVSAAELNFNTEEITDRFVRGDSSRNTEGSGLGLAIAKSFTELQYGTLKVSTEADLFKVEICFPKRSAAGGGTGNDAAVLMLPEAP